MQKPQRPQTNPGQITPRKKLDLASLIIMIVFTLIGIAAGIGLFIVVKNIVIAWESTPLPGAPVEMVDNQQPLAADVTPTVEAIQAPDEIAPDPWDGASRVTLLVMGLDYRDWEAGEIPRSDSMILLSLDPVALNAAMLSIPRDMWVSIPGFDHGPINTAYFLGEAYKMPGGGPALASKTVEEFIGIPVDYYAQIDWGAFVTFIDEIGGVDINVKDYITVDPLGPGNTVILGPGVQTLDGATTLAYARTRHDAGDDFGRAERQQQVIMAVRDNILNFYSLPKLVSRAPTLFTELSAGVKTNMTLDEAIKLAWIVQNIPEKKIRRGVIGTDMITFGNVEGKDIVKPIPDKIRLLRDKLFTTNGPLGPAASQNNEIALRQAEGARVSVFNGTQDPNLLGRSAQFFSGQGLTIVAQNNADRLYDASTIIIYNGKPNTITYLSQTMNITSTHILAQYTPDSAVDIAVILGYDWSVNNTIP